MNSINYKTGCINIFHSTAQSHEKPKTSLQLTFIFHRVGMLTIFNEEYGEISIK